MPDCAPRNRCADGEVFRWVQGSRIAIDGHTDNVGEDGDNIVLSHERAYSVWQELVRLGLPERALSSRGFGETRPIADNESAEGREKNRRVEFLVLKPKGTVSTCW